MNITDSTRKRYDQCLGEIGSYLSIKRFNVTADNFEYEIDFTNEWVWINLCFIHTFDDNDEMRLKIYNQFPWVNKTNGFTSMDKLNSLFKEWHKLYYKASYDRFILVLELGMKEVQNKVTKINNELCLGLKTYSLEYPAASLLMQASSVVDIGDLMCSKPERFDMIVARNFKDAFEIKNFDTARSDGFITDDDIESIYETIRSIMGVLMVYIARRRVYCVNSEGEPCYVKQYVSNISVRETLKKFGFDHDAMVVPDTTIHA